MNDIGKPERTTQNRIIQLFQEQLGYDYLGDWQEELRILPVEEKRFRQFLICRMDCTEPTKRFTKCSAMAFRYRKKWAI